MAALLSESVLREEEGDRFPIAAQGATGGPGRWAPLAARVLSRSQIPGTFSFGETMLRLFALGCPPGSGFLLTKQYGPKLWLYKTSQQFYFVVSGMDDFRSNNYLHQIDGFSFQPGDWRLL